ncbi:hypothetical protein BGZ93_000022 [Podila epicladia]|nr:hypothetical protein BGZ92_004470 [Podila epicladia]KAG0100835.1 hypothetical protein BGZ93_000022 [Podila epicladia]
MPLHSHIGLGLSRPLILNVATAPAERIRLFMQTQDEVILNLRQESDLKQRSIIAHAQLPYKDVQDCYQRLVEKEGPKSLWRGYGTEVSRYVLQEGIERWMRKSHLFQGLRDMFLLNREKYGTLGWCIGLTVSGTVTQSIALVALYPLTLLHTRLATDVVRKSKKPTSKIKNKQHVKAETTEAVEEQDSEEGYKVSKDSSSIEFVHLEGSESTLPQDVTESQEQESIKMELSHTPVLLNGEDDEEVDDTDSVYEFDYKYHGIKDAYKQIVASEGYMGLYRGVSCVIAGTFVSRIGYLTIFNFLTPILLKSGTSGWAGMGSFAVMLGSTSLIGLATYPLSTIAHRRMISGDRYTSSCDAAQQIVEKQGVRALFQGVEIFLARGVILAVIGSLYV